MRLVALTAVAMLGTGCFVSSSDSGPINPGSGDALVYWNFTDWDHTVAGNFTAATPGCDVAAVTEVDLLVTRGGAQVEFLTHPCQANNGVPGTTVPNLAPGTYGFRATAYRGSDPVFENTGSFVIADGLQTTVQTTLDVLTPQPLSIFFSKAGAFTCAGVTGGVTYALYTSGGASLISSTTIACPANQELYFPQAAASQVGSTYFVDFLQLLDGAGLSTNEKCKFSVRHTGFPVTIDLPAGIDPACG